MITTESAGGESFRLQGGQIAFGRTSGGLFVPLRCATDGSLIISGTGGGGAATVAIDQTTPGSTNGVQPKQYAGVPSSFSILTAEGAVFTLAAGEIGFIQNLSGADSLAVKKGASASSTSLNWVLQAGAAADDGHGGSTLIDDWIGVVSVAKIGTAARYLAWKQAP